MNETFDERKGRPSASRGDSLEKCPGSHGASSLFKSKSSAAAELGSQQHEVMAGIELDLQDVNMEDCREAERQRDTVLDFVYPNWRNCPPSIVLEERIWYRRDRYSGVPDLLAMRDGRGLIVDYKFGRIKVPEAKRNAQLKWLAVLVDCKLKLVDEITVCIIQPRCGAFTTHTYDREALRKARLAVTRHLRRVESRPLILRPGASQCRYCAAREACPALRGKAEGIAAIDKVEMLTPSQLATAMNMVDAVESSCKAIRSRASEALKADPDSLPGYELVKGITRRSVKDALSAFMALRRAGLVGADEAERFISYSTIGITKLQKLVENDGEISRAEAAESVAIALEDIITRKEGEPKPCRVE